MLSTRRDLLPDDIALELAKLQDRVPPFSGEQARTIIEKAYGQPLDAVFTEFTTQPLASASIAQVHAARLLNGREVVVKVLRPAIEKVIRRDVELLYIVARLAQRYWKEGRRLRPLEVVGEYEKTIFDELDLVREAANASQLRHNFQASPLLYVPEVLWQQGFDTGHYLPGEDHHCPCNVNPYIDPRDQPVPDVTDGPEVGPTITITRRKYTFALLVLGTLAALLAGIGAAVGSAIIVSLIESNPL